MTKPIDRSGVSNDNYIPVDEDKINDDQKNELHEAVKKTSANPSNLIVLIDLVK